MTKKLTLAQHRKRHRELHRSLDELLADFIGQTRKQPSKATIMELLTWSHEQILQPTTKNLI